MGEEIQALHTLKDQVTEVNQSGRGTRSGIDGTMRLGMDYTFKMTTGSLPPTILRPANPILNGRPPQPSWYWNPDSRWKNA